MDTRANTQNILLPFFSVLSSLIDSFSTYLFCPFLAYLLPAFFPLSPDFLPSSLFISILYLSDILTKDYLKSLFSLSIVHTCFMSAMAPS